jgi:putative transposase
MNKKDLETFAREAIKTLKAKKYFPDFSAMLTKVTMAAALNAELDDHLGYDKHAQSSWDNSRNWLKSTKHALAQ